MSVVLLLGVNGCGGGRGGNASTASRTCSQIDLRKAPASPVEIRFGGGTGTESYATLYAIDGIAPASAKPNAGKWYTFKMVPFAAGPQRFTAFQAGQLDALISPPPGPYVAFQAGVQMQAVAEAVRVILDDYLDNPWIVLNDSPVKSYRDFKGKTIGVYGLNSTNELAARAAVELGGGNPTSDVKIVPLAGPAMIPALRSHQVDIATGIEPFLTQETTKGDLRKVGSIAGVFQQKIHITYFSGIDILFGNSFFAQNSGAVCAWLADYRSSIKWAKDNLADFRKAEVDKGYVPGPLDASKSPAPSMPDNAILDVTSGKAVADLAEKYGMLQGHMDWAKYVSAAAMTQ